MRTRIGRAAALLLAALDTLSEWQERAGQRRRLAGLDDRMLKDIGLSRADACREYAEPFWRRGGRG